MRQIVKFSSTLECCNSCDGDAAEREGGAV